MLVSLPWLLTDEESCVANNPLSYKDAGVDIDAGNRLVDNIKQYAKTTTRPEVLGGLGGFGALFQIPLEKYQQPILVAGTDGVGTKLKLAIELGIHDTIGIDLVAMCVNDLIVQGAEPLFFLDYYATSQLDVAIASEVVKGIAAGCQQAGCALTGGETAEMPGLYQHKDYDLAGFCVGIVEKTQLIDGSHVKPGDAIIALASSGPHSNGYSLINKVIEINAIDVNMPFANSTLGKSLLTPTRIYVKSILELLKHHSVNAIAHITGGGLLENIPRVLPTNCKAVIDSNSWQWPEIFTWLQQQGSIETTEMYRTFNCGVGMVIVVAQDKVASCIQSLEQSGETAWCIGHIAEKTSASAVEIR